MASTENTPAETRTEKPRPQRKGPRGAMERAFVRVFAIVGIIGIGVALGAILSSSNTQGWIIGLVVAVVTFVLTGLLRSTRQLRP